MDDNSEKNAFLETPTMMELASSTAVVKHRRGEILFRRGEPCNSLPVIESGNAHVYASNNQGQQITLYWLTTGVICPVSLAALLQDGTYPASAIAECDMRVRYLPGEKLKAAVTGTPETFRIFLDTFAGCLHDAVTMRLEHFLPTPLATHQKIPNTKDLKGIAMMPSGIFT